jgi:hypothetical protein
VERDTQLFASEVGEEGRVGFCWLLLYTRYTYWYIYILDSKRESPGGIKGVNSSWIKKGDRIVDWKEEEDAGSSGRKVWEEREGKGRGCKGAEGGNVVAKRGRRKGRDERGWRGKREGGWVEWERRCGVCTRGWVKNVKTAWWGGGVGVKICERKEELWRMWAGGMRRWRCV